MPILDSELLWRPALLVSDSTPAQNGGRMNFAASIASGVKNNLFPDVGQAERLAGSETLRKAFIHVASTSETALTGVRVFLDQLTPADDCVVFHPGTHTDTQDQLTARGYGIGTLYASVAAGATQIVVVGEHPASYATLQPFRIGDALRIADGNALTAAHEEFFAVSAVLYDAGTIALTLDAPLANAYTTSALVSSVHAPGEVQAAVPSAPTFTSAAGTFDGSGGKLAASNKGSIADTFTLSFDSATTFSAAGVLAGNLGSGSTAAIFSPSNPANARPYFTLQPTAFGGSFAPGDTVSFSTVPASVPLWYRRIVPAGANSLANDACALAITGESA